MTEKTFNYTLRYYLFQMGRLKTMTVFSCIFGILGFPLLAAAEALSRYSSDYDNISVPMYVISVISIFIIAVLSFITPLVACKHLYTKTSADNILSLPLTTTQRFIGDICAILTSYSLPFIISVGISYISEYAFMFAINKHTDANFREAALFAFFATLEFIALNTAIITCCGRLAEAILYPVAVNIIMPLAITYGGEIAFVHAFGVSGGTVETLQSSIYNMWPLAFLLNIRSYMGAILWAAIFSVVYFALAYLGYRKRRAQNIGKPFVFRYSYLITTVVIGIAFIISYIWLVDMAYIYDKDYFPQTGTIIAIVVILLIMMLIMELVNYKKIHSIPKFALHYAGTLGGGFLVFFLLLSSKGFYLGYYVPNTSSVESVSINGYYYDSDWASGVETYFYTENKETIDFIKDEHQYIIDNSDQYYNPYDIAGYSPQLGTLYNTSFTYHMNNGSLMNRHYSSDAGNPHIWEKLYASEEYRLNEIINIKSWIESSDRPAVIRLQNRHSKQVYLTYSEENLLESEIYKALEADLKADTRYGRHNENSVGVLLIGSAIQNGDKYVLPSPTEEFYGFESIVIYESYVNTINVLKQHGTVPTTEQAAEDSVKNCELFMLARVPTNGIDMAAVSVLSNSNSETAIFITEEEFRELTSKQVKYNIFDGEDTSDDYQYTLIRGGWSFLDQARDKEIIIEALEKDGIAVSNYDIFDDYTSNLFGSWHADANINTEYNSYCDALFEKRTVFKISDEESEIIGRPIIMTE